MQSYSGIKPHLEKGVFIAEGAHVIGNVKMGRNSSVFFNSVVRGDVNSIVIGEDTNIQDNCTIHVTEEFSVTIGDGVTVGHNAVVHGCTVGNDVLIGIGAIVLDGAVIGSGSIVAAGSLVPPGKEFPAGVMIMGSPAKVVRELRDSEKGIPRKPAENYLKLKERYLEDRALK